MVVGNALWVGLWLAVGVVGLVVGLVWLRSVERGHRQSALLLVDASLSTVAGAGVAEPDALAG